MKLFHIVCLASAINIANGTALSASTYAAGNTYYSNLSDELPEALVSSTEVLIVGAGISGSTAAYYLNKAGIDVKLTESASSAGGAMISNTVDGYTWEEGPNSFQPNPTILRFAKDIGLLDELILADGGLPRFVFWDNELQALPGKLSDIPGFKLLSLRGKIRAGLGLLGFVAPKPADGYEESVKEFMTRHLGEEVYTRIVDPFVSGVYAGDPTKLSISAAFRKVKALEDQGYRGLLLGGLARARQVAKARNISANADLPKIPVGSLGSFKRGMQSMPLKVHELLGSDKVLLSNKLVSVRRDEAGYYVCTFQQQHDESLQTIRLFLSFNMLSSNADVR